MTAERSRVFTTDLSEFVRNERARVEAWHMEGWLAGARGEPRRFSVDPAWTDGWISGAEARRREAGLAARYAANTI